MNVDEDTNCSEEVVAPSLFNDHDDREAERERFEALYRKRFNRVVHELLSELRIYAKNPQSHPLYPTEWNAFWTRRCEELKAGNKLEFKMFIF